VVDVHVDTLSKGSGRVVAVMVKNAVSTLRMQKFLLVRANF
jgi:hypothetical protein